MSTLIIGSHCESTAEYHKKINRAASILIESCDQIFDVGHTSIADMGSYKNLELVASKATHVYWAQCGTEEFETLDDYVDFVFWLKDFNRRYRTVRNFQSVTVDPYGIKETFRPSPEQAVFFGCSFTAGTGLSDPTTHYSNILSNYFNKEVYNLARGGGSNDLIFNRFVNTQWNPEQLVVVQLTMPHRLYYCTDDFQKLNVILGSDNKHLRDKVLQQSLVEVYKKPWVFTQLIDKVNAMNRIAEQNRLRMALWLIDYKNPDLYSSYDQTYFYHMKSFVPASLMQNYMIDFAEDNLHPGIRSNQIIADVLHKFILEVY